MEEWNLLERLIGRDPVVLPPLYCDSADISPRSKEEDADAFAIWRLEGKGQATEYFNFLVEVKARSTPKCVHQAIYQIQSFIKKRADPEVYPMIMVPYLSEARLKELEEAGVSGIDLCGNGIVTVPGRLLIYRTGNPNRHPESRAVSNPFQGKSAMVGRIFLTDLVILGSEGFDTLGRLRQEVQKLGVEISLPQVSKTVSALQEERILGSRGRAVYILDPDQLLDRLSASWKPEIRRRVFLKMVNGRDDISTLGDDADLKWAVTGASSVGRYGMFSQGGPRQVAVSSIAKAMAKMKCQEERVPNFADLELLETDEPGFYFANEKSEGIKWASRLQTWIELSNGDARQQDAARDIRQQLITSEE